MPRQRKVKVSTVTSNNSQMQCSASTSIESGQEKPDHSLNSALSDYEESDSNLHDQNITQIAELPLGSNNNVVCDLRKENNSIYDSLPSQVNNLNILDMPSST